MKVGGAAEWLLEPADPDELRQAWLRAHELGFAPRILGGGANLIVADGVLSGVVVATDRLRRLFRPSPDAPAGGPAREALDADGGLPVSTAHDAGAFWSERAHADPRLVAWCGVSMPGIARAAQELGWSGFEGLVGVPGHVGGGLAMNAGGRWGSVWDVVELVRVLAPDGAVADLAREQCSPCYRDGGLEGRVALACVLRLRPEGIAAVRARTREFLLEKNQSQPVAEHSSGCIFKNPDPELADGRSAGKLIEDCGAKGLARGDAVVSAKHANFIVNRGAASAADVLGLIADVRALVESKTGIRLEREVRVWGADG